MNHGDDAAQGDRRRAVRRSVPPAFPRRTCSPGSIPARRWRRPVVRHRAGS